MDRLALIRVFIQVAESQSFAKAARHLGMSRASVTKQVAALESDLEARLLNRNTQYVSLTTAGSLLLDRGKKLLSGYEDMEDEVRTRVNGPRGSLRIGVPSYYGEYYLLPAIVAFRKQNQEISVDLYQDMGDMDLIKEGLDASIRISSNLNDANYIAKLLMRVPQMLVASPGFLERYGTPTAPADLAGFNCLVHSIRSPNGIWKFRKGGTVHSVQVKGWLKSDFGQVIRRAALMGEGIAEQPLYVISEDLKQERLRIILPDYEPMGINIYAIYAHRNNMPLRLRAFIDFLKSWTATESGWGETLDFSLDRERSLVDENLAK